MTARVRNEKCGSTGHTKKDLQACQVGHHLPTPWVPILLGHPEKYKQVTHGRHKQAIIINLYLSLTSQTFP